MDNGLIKKITEQYLVDSNSFTECEARVISEQGEGIREVTVKAIARSPIKEVVFYGDTDLWFKCKVQYSLMDEETEKEKKVTTYLLVNANDAKEAYERTEEHLKEMLVPFEIPSIQQSPIVDVYQYQQGLRPKHVDDKIGDLARDFKKSMQKIANESGSTISVSGDGVNFKEIAAPVKSALDAAASGEKFVDVGCAYSKSDQVGKKRKHQRSHDDGHGHPIIELPLVKPIDPTGGQAVDFTIDKDIADWWLEQNESLRQSLFQSFQQLPLRDFLQQAAIATNLSDEMIEKLGEMLCGGIGAVKEFLWDEEPAETRNRFYNSNRPPSFDD